MRDIPKPRGNVTVAKPLKDVTWLRVGGVADYFFQPADLDDLRGFLKELAPEVPVFPIGLGSNLIVRDGGIRGVVIRLGRGFNQIEIDGRRVRAGAAALDAHVARKAALAGIDLTFLRTIPGSIGGAVCLNAGCYGSYVADHLIEVEMVLPDGELRVVPASALNLRYRQSALPTGAIVTAALFEGRQETPKSLEARMQAQIAKRDATQPTKELCAGSTFRNPAGFSSTGRDDDTHELKAWKLIQDAGMQGVPLGGAIMSPKHANFLVNQGEASAWELEELGEQVRKKVFKTHKIALEWEIMRVGEYD